MIFVTSKVSSKLIKYKGNMLLLEIYIWDGAIGESCWEGYFALDNRVFQNYLQ